MRRLLCTVCVAFGAMGCDVSVGSGMLQGDLFAAVRTGEVLSGLCGVPLTDADVGLASLEEVTFTDVHATRPMLGGPGHGTARVTYAPTSGPTAGRRCEGTIAFDFEQHSATQQLNRRSSVTFSQFDIENIRTAPAGTEPAH
ncbi:Hypothetical protein I5071_1640 (plasmid) [Sandaracinus amylolyticus]|nr:Hypothetical protein MSR10575_89210 [Sandaracinus sp.]UJR87372.1 Hypothetical protein I5071_1640 [Sandaracinus amylolyticus]